MGDRPAVPLPLKRALLLEAGHRCAIPTCRQPTVELAHIVPWSEIRTHEFENMIALCPTCHRRFHNQEIDRLSMLTYKHNLGLLYGRYGEAERRLMDMFVREETEEYELEDGMTVADAIQIDSIRDFDFYYLLRDGLLERVDVGPQVNIGGIPLGPQLYRLTDEGREFARRLASGQEASGQEGELT